MYCNSVSSRFAQTVAMHAITRQPRRIAALSVGCGLLAVGLATRWEARAAFRSIAAGRQTVFGVTQSTAYSVPFWRTATRFSSSLSSIFASSPLSSSNMANLTPPQPPPVWTHTPKDVLSLTKEAIRKDREVQDKVAKLPASECNFDTVSTTPVYVVATLAYIA
jgi:hypothetical protein